MTPANLLAERSDVVLPLLLEDVAAPDEFDDSGLRISTDCVCRRIRESFDKTLYPEFPKAIGVRGHGFEDVFSRTVLAGAKHFRELTVPWGHGESHLDFVVPHDALGRDGKAHRYAGHIIELKANGDSLASEENIRQVQRQQFALDTCPGKAYVNKTVTADGDVLEERTRFDPAHLLADYSWRIIVIDPTWWQIENPNGYTVRLHDDRHAELVAEWAIVDSIMADPAKAKRELHDQSKFWPPCSCGQCWPAPMSVLTGEALEVASTYLFAAEAMKEAEQEKELAGRKLRSLVTAIMDPTEDGKRVYEAEGVRVTLQADPPPSETIEYAKGFAALGPDSNLQSIRAGGFVKLREAKGQMRVTRPKPKPVKQ